MECYLREKREAILEDRKNHFGDLKVILSNGAGNTDTGKEGVEVGAVAVDDDQKSCLQQVQERYQGLREDAGGADARSRRSHISKTAS